MGPGDEGRIVLRIRAKSSCEIGWLEIVPEERVARLGDVGREPLRAGRVVQRQHHRDRDQPLGVRGSAQQGAGGQLDRVARNGAGRAGERRRGKQDRGEQRQAAKSLLNGGFPGCRLHVSSW